VRQANRAKSEFVSFVAHELRTPMTSIRGYADMLARQMVGDLSPQQVEFVQTISSNVERMQVLVADLQDAARIETGQLRLEARPTSLAEVLEEALKATRGQIEERSQNLSLDVPDDVPQISADPARLTQVLINLLSNACKYTPEKGSIIVKAWTKGDFVHCAVTDNGIGMSKEDLEQLFSKFFRSENPKVREMPGTGLGLNITRSLVELQGGEMNVESELEKGTTFSFTMPVVKE